MPQHLIILTGASRGMGLAMAHQLLHPDNTLLCISRTAGTGCKGLWPSTLRARPSSTTPG